jgi:UDP-glucose 4-epimerase
MKDKLILVTGGAGFIGSHLCERFVQEGARVISLDNYFTGSRENHVAGVDYREGHTKDIERLVPESPDVVYHLGEYSRVEKSFEDVEQVWELNQFGTFAVLEFARHRGAKLIYAGSSTKFGDNGLGRDQSPYAWSKASMTDLVRNYGDWFGLNYAITYFYNVYGPRESSSSFGTVVAIFCEQYSRGVPRTVVAPGTQERIFTHVQDIVEGLVAVGEKGSGDGYGIGGNDKLSILELAQLFGEDMLMLPERQGNRRIASIDTTSTESLGWRASRSLRTYIDNFLKAAMPSSAPQRRILVFTTTFHPVAGPAEEAFLALTKKLPSIHFDVITSAFTKDVFSMPALGDNVTVHAVGFGNRFDKYLLPILGRRKAFALVAENSYLFAWSLMASYGALPALAVRRNHLVPLLITLADQALSWHERLFLGFITKRSDQVYTSLPEQDKKIISLEDRMKARKSLGAGDALANQIRFAYSQILATQRKYRI